MLDGDLPTISDIALHIAGDTHQAVLRSVLESLADQLTWSIGKEKNAISQPELRIRLQSMKASIEFLRKSYANPQILELIYPHNELGNEAIRDIPRHSEWNSLVEGIETALKYLPSTGKDAKGGRPKSVWQFSGQVYCALIVGMCCEAIHGEWPSHMDSKIQLACSDLYKRATGLAGKQATIGSPDPWNSAWRNHLRDAKKARNSNSFETTVIARYLQDFPHPPDLS